MPQEELQQLINKQWLLPCGFWKNIEIKDKDIVVIQTKASRLGMNVMGQAFFSIELMKKYLPKSIKSVIVCNKDDEVLRPIAEMYGLQIKVYI